MKEWNVIQDAIPAESFSVRETERIPTQLSTNLMEILASSNVYLLLNDDFRHEGK